MELMGVKHLHVVREMVAGGRLTVVSVAQTTISSSMNPETAVTCTRVAIIKTSLEVIKWQNIGATFSGQSPYSADIFPYRLLCGITLIGPKHLVALC